MKKAVAAMDSVLIAAAIGAAVLAIGTLAHLILRSMLHRHKWAVALRTAPTLLKKRNVRAMQRALNAGPPGERLGAAIALSELSSRASTKALRQALANDREPDVRSAAATALGARRGAEVTKTLSSAATDDVSAVVRGAAVEALGTGEHDSAGPVLIDVLREAAIRPWRPGIRARVGIGAMAATALGSIGGAEAIAALGAAQSSPHPGIRRAARDALTIISLRQRANSDDADAATLRDLAAAHIVRREFRQAIRWLERVRHMEPDDPETFETLGTLHHKLGEHEKAEESYNKAVELAPNEPFPHFGLGVIYERRGDGSAALDAFNRYLKLAPDGEQAESARQFIAQLSGE